MHPPEHLTIDQLLAAFPEDCRRFIAAKWLLDRWSWTSGNPPRCPGDANTLAARLRTSPWAATNEDAKWVADLAQAMQVDMQLRQHMPFAAVPIENAQAWWDSQYGNIFNCDGELT